jgi:hypothetical protein
MLETTEGSGKSGARLARSWASRRRRLAMQNPTKEYPGVSVMQALYHKTDYAMVYEPIQRHGPNLISIGARYRGADLVGLFLRPLATRFRMGQFG